MTAPEGAGGQQDGTQDSGREIAQLVFLRRLVTALTLTMIAGIVTIVAVVVLRFPGPGGQHAIALPEAITLPPGMEAQVFTRGPDWFAVADAQQIAIFDAASGTLLQRIEIRPTP